MVRTEDGGRQRPIGGDPYPPGGYRANWGLPGMEPGEQAGGPVLCFGHLPVSPGDTVRAVIIPMFPEHVGSWWDLTVGDHLLLYEGSRVCGRACVAWAITTESARSPRGTAVMQYRVTDDDLERFSAWARGGPVPS